jgi:serine phosphatase RsbU (regulator of sigma subunit)
MTDLKSRSERKWPDRRLLMTWLAATLVAVLISLALGQRMQRGVFDSWQRISPRDLKATDVRVVLIDDPSIELVGPWQWPRYYMARLTEELARRGAKVIAFDILFSEHDRVQPDIFASLYPELDPDTAAKVKALQPMDQLFGQVVGRSPVILGHAAVSEAAEGQPPIADTSVGGKLPPDIDSWPVELAAIPELDDVALGHGVLNGPPDSDGVTRRLPLVLRAAGKARPGLALEIARNILGAEGIEAHKSSVRVDGRTIPMDRHGRMAIHFGEFPADKIYSAADLLGDSKALKGDAFAGKPVLIGLSAAGSTDIAATPLASEYYGPLIHAQAVDAMLRGGWLVRPAWAGWLEWWAAAALALFAVGAARLGRGYRLFLGTAFVAVPVASWLAFARGSLLLDPARPLLVGGGAIAGVAIGMFALARVERERLRQELISEQIAAAAAESELQVARDIQLSMVPPRSRLRAIDPRVDVDALLEPAKSVGGDFYDAIRIGEKQIGFLTADVAGKGVPAALFMAMSKALTSTALSHMAADPANLAEAINSELLKDNREAMSVAMLIGVLDLGSGVARMVCAGHEDPFLLPAGGGLKRLSLDGGPPFGVTDFPYPLESVTLAPGDTLILVTDGVTEAQDPQGRLFGRDRLLTIGASGATAICEAIRDRVRQFEAGEDPTDDFTVMAIRRR